jgi:hypothetical protein
MTDHLKRRASEAKKRGMEILVVDLLSLTVDLAPGPSLSSVTDFHPVTALAGAPVASVSTGVASSVTTAS